MRNTVSAGAQLEQPSRLRSCAVVRCGMRPMAPTNRPVDVHGHGDAGDGLAPRESVVGRPSAEFRRGSEMCELGEQRGAHEQRRCSAAAAGPPGAMPDLVVICTEHEGSGA
jgi:hypothetical protein